MSSILFEYSIPPIFENKKNPLSSIYYGRNVDCEMWNIQQVQWKSTNVSKNFRINIFFFFLRFFFDFFFDFFFRFFLIDSFVMGDGKNDLVVEISP